MLARLLTLLTQNAPGNTRLEERFNKLAERIAINRTVAGVHFPVDSAAGQVLGTSLADYLVCVASFGTDALRGESSKGWKARIFKRDPASYKDRDFARTDLANFVDNDPAKSPKVVYPPAKRRAASARKSTAPQTPLQWLWVAAASEWPLSGEAASGN